MRIALYSLKGEFTIVRHADVETVSEAQKMVEKHIAESGYSNLRIVDDQDYSLRFIADPPTGRRGRNVASLDL